MKRILITGVDGFIGKNLVEYLDGMYDILPVSRKEADLLDQKQVERLFQKETIDTVIHSATQSTLGKGREYELTLLKNNLKMFFNLERCHSFYGKLIFLGSGAEYDKRQSLAFVGEEDFDNFVPDDDYGFSKYIMSKMMSNSDKIYNLRLFGIFGPYENYNYRFISNVICKALSGRNIIIHQNVMFDYLYIKDLCKILPWFIENIPCHNCYNVCTGEQHDIVSIAKEIVKQTGSASRIQVEKAGWNKTYSGSNKRLIKEIGSIAFTPLEKAIGELINYYKDISFCLEGDY